jgi:HAMP domain-containing protein
MCCRDSDGHGGSIRAHAAVDEKEKSPVTDGTRYKFLAPIYHVESTTGTAPRTNDAVETRKQIGLVSVTLSRAALQTEQNRILFQSLFMVALGLVATVVFALRMARTVTRPVLSLTRAVDKIKNGQLDHRVATQSGGEVGRLEDGINAMAAALQEARDKEKKRSEDALFLEKVRAQVTLESIGDGVITTARRLDRVHESVAEQFTEWKATPRARQTAFSVQDFARIPSASKSTHPLLPPGRPRHRHDSHHLLMSHEAGRSKSGSQRRYVTDGTILGAVVVFPRHRDQSMARRMAFLASHDPLRDCSTARVRDAPESGPQSAELGSASTLLYRSRSVQIVNDTWGISRAMSS